MWKKFNPGGLGIGMMFGVAIGSAAHSLAWGIGIGTALGILYGFALGIGPILAKSMGLLQPAPPGPDEAGGFWTRLGRAPVTLRLYIGFALVASAVTFSVFYAPRLNAAIIPYTGWNGLMFYTFGLIFAMPAVAPAKRNLVYAVILFAGMAALFGVADTLWHTLGSAARWPDYHNPWLAYSRYRPLVTVALPLLWILPLARIARTPAARKTISHTE